MWEFLGLYFSFLTFVLPTPNLMVFFQLTFIESLPKLSSSLETHLELETTLHVPLLYTFP